MVPGIAELTPCPGCGYENRLEVLICNMCSQVLRRRDEAAVAAPDGPEHAVPVPDRTAPRQSGFDLYAPPEALHQIRIERREKPDAGPAGRLYDGPARQPGGVYEGPVQAPGGLYEGPARQPGDKSWMQPVFTAKSWKYHLGIGLGLGLFFSLPVHLIRSIGWFFSSLTHEMGHTMISYYLGSIALPALRLDGHAATVHMEQSVLLAALVWLALAAGTAYFRLAKRAPVFWTLLALTVTYPILAFTSLKDYFFLIGGHGGELVLATIFFWRAAVISHKVREQERTLYAALAWYLWFQNIVLHWSLLMSEASRDWYLSNGSFGLENDFVRIADELHWSLPMLSGVMLLVTLSVPPLGLLWAWWSMGGHMKPQASSWDD